MQASLTRSSSCPAGAWAGTLAERAVPYWKVEVEEPEEPSVVDQGDDPLGREGADWGRDPEVQVEHGDDLAADAQGDRLGLVVTGSSSLRDHRKRDAEDAVVEGDAVLPEHSVRAELASSDDDSDGHGDGGRSGERDEGPSTSGSHLRVHGMAWRWKCKFCSKTFTGKYKLEEHVRVHTGERPFKCEFCEQSFIQRSHLVVHTRTHTGEKPFECDICKRRFAIKKTLSIHMKTHR